MAEWPEGTEVIALYTLKSQSPDDLSFSRGEKLVIVNATRDPMWYKAQKANGKVGMLPANYVQPCSQLKCPTPQTKISNMAWFHGKISRSMAEMMLQRSGRDGCYLVRESANFQGDYTLCVIYKNKVEHYHIVYQNGNLTIDEESHFKDLHALVKHYQMDKDGLVCNLRMALPRSQASSSENPEMFFLSSTWNISLEDIQFGDQLGKGESGEVYKGKLKGEDVAIKLIKDKAMVNAFLQEAAVMTTLKHKNLVNLKGVVLGPSTYIIVELMMKGSLVDYLRTRGRTVITPADQIRFSKDACAGMAYLSQRGIVHRDLAARNILLHEDGTAKVADFGLALPELTSTPPTPPPLTTTSTSSATDAGVPLNNRFPIKWTAPEAIKDSKMFTSKSDVWSFGILLWEIYSFGRVPYPRIPLQEVLNHVERGYRMEPPDGCPPFIASIMSKTWNIDPNKRPTFQAIESELSTY